MNPSISVWAIAVGLTGFVCGFVGPILLNPEANQGPLMGIFFSGPAGLVLGAALGTVMRLFRVDSTVSSLALAATCVIGGGVTLFLVLPQPRLDTTLVDIEVRSCVPALDLRERAFAEWDKKLALPGWGSPAPDWRGHFERTAIGSVLTVTTHRHRQIWTGQAPWNKGKRWADDWMPGAAEFKHASEFYTSSSCAAFPAGTQRVFVAERPIWDGRYPPQDPSGFLEMADLVAVPQSLTSLSR